MNPRLGVRVMSAVGSTSTVLVRRAQTKNWRRAVRRHRRLGTPGVEERFDVAGLDGGPVGLGSFIGQEDGQIPDDAEGAFDGGVGPGVGACPQRSFPRPHQMFAEQAHCQT